MSENNRVKLWMKMVDKRGCEGVVGNKLISECLSHDQAISNNQHRPGIASFPGSPLAPTENKKEGESLGSIRT